MSSRDIASTPGPQGPPHPFPGSEQFRNHPDSVMTRVQRRPFALSPPLLITRCPLDVDGPFLGMLRQSVCGSHREHTRAIAAGEPASGPAPFEPAFRPVRPSDEDFALCAAARRTRPIRHWYRVPLFWERGRDVRPDAPPQAIQMHAEALINQRLVHIDVSGSGDLGSGIRKLGSGIWDVGSERSERSGRSESRDPADGIGDTNDRDGDHSLVEIWIFVDGRLSGCASASLEGGCSLPAVACIHPALAISVDDAIDARGPVVELWAVE